MHRHEQNTEATVTLTISEWRTVHAALRMTGATCEAARDAGDWGASRPEPFYALASQVWAQGVTPPNRRELLTEKENAR